MPPVAYPTNLGTFGHYRLPHGSAILCRLGNAEDTTRHLRQGKPMTSPDSQPGQPTTPPKKSRRKLWIILGVVGGLLLLCCCGSVGIAISRSSSTTTAATTAPSPQAASDPRLQGS
jgi:hypothetical protein